MWAQWTVRTCCAQGGDVLHGVQLGLGNDQLSRQLGCTAPAAAPAWRALHPCTSWPAPPPEYLRQHSSGVSMLSAWGHSHIACAFECDAFLLGRFSLSLPHVLCNMTGAGQRKVFAPDQLQWMHPRGQDSAREHIITSDLKGLKEHDRATAAVHLHSHMLCLQQSA